MPGRRRRAARFATGAGLTSGSAPFSPLRRPPSPPIGRFRRLIEVPVGNDGIAAPVTLGAAGTGTARCGPSGVGAAWSLDQANVYTSVGALDPAQASVFIGPSPLAQYQVAASLAGGAAQVALGGVSLDPGWSVWAVWSGGAPGTVGYLYVTGAKTALVM